jgi:hypothetical protein
MFPIPQCRLSNRVSNPRERRFCKPQIETGFEVAIGKHLERETL